MSSPVAAGTPSDQSPTDLALGRVLGLVILLPVINALLHPSAAHVGAAALGLVALALHQVVLLDRPWPPGTVLAMVIAMLLAGYAAHRLTGDSWLLVATAAAICAAVRLRPLQLALVAVAGCTVAAFALTPASTMASTTVLLVAGPGAIAALRQRLVSTIAELQATREELAQVAVEAERSRFSDELHDVLGHSLSVMVVAAQVVQKSVTRAPEQAIESAHEIEQVGRRALDEVRDTVSEYRGRTVRFRTSGRRTGFSGQCDHRHQQLRPAGPLRSRRDVGGDPAGTRDQRDPAQRRHAVLVGAVGHRRHRHPDGQRQRHRAGCSTTGRGRSADGSPPR